MDEEEEGLNGKSINTIQTLCKLSMRRAARACEVVEEERPRLEARPLMRVIFLTCSKRRCYSLEASKALSDEPFPEQKGSPGQMRPHRHVPASASS